MTKAKPTASHYTTAQISRILGIEYSRMRAVMVRVPGCRVSIAGTPMIAAEHIPKLRTTVQKIDRERDSK